jgi:hypothetical protein
MSSHALLALVRWLYERNVAQYPSAPRASCWPTRDIVVSAIGQNRKYFPGGVSPLSSLRDVLQGNYWLEVGPCPHAQVWHRCEHWQLTEAGLAALELMNREKCGRGVTKGRCMHRRLAGDFELREVAA